jgi:hypothetical protein
MPIDTSLRSPLEDLTSSKHVSVRGRPLLIIDVDTGDNEKDRIEVFKND